MTLKIAFDGGAFQQGIAGGIFTVAVGLLNAATALDENFSYVLVTDPRLGPVREELLGQLDRRPEIVQGEIGPGYDAPLRGPITREPRFMLEIDGRLETPVRDGLSFTYEGPPPQRSCYLRSRASRPVDSIGNNDTRLLGVPLRLLQITDAEGTRTIPHNDPLLNDGFHVAEPAQRWTNGRGRVPVSLLASRSPRVRITVELNATMSYKLLNGAFDGSFNRLSARVQEIGRGQRTADVEQALLGMGVEIYCVNHFIPAAMRRLKTVSLLYDMIPVLHQKFFMADARLNFEHNIKAFNNSRHVFSISEASRADLLRLEDLPPDRVTAVGIDAATDYAPPVPAERDRVLAARRLAARPYILCVGTVEPRKNHQALLAAFDLAFRERGFPFDLVVVGKLGWGFEGFLAQVQERGLQPFIRMLDDVSNAELASIYAGARFCAYVSLYEGFGLPVLEAMACGCPVLTSNTSSMPEIAGDAALLVNPHDVDAIASGLRELADNEALRSVLVERGHKRRALFDWRISARRVLDLLEDVARETAA